MRDVLLVAGGIGGGEAVLTRTLLEAPPPGVRYGAATEWHADVEGAACRRWLEAGFNRLVHPFLRPLPGLRAYRVDPGRWDLVHVHNFPARVDPPGIPLVWTVGGGGYPHYLREYLGMTEREIGALYRRGRRAWKAVGAREGTVAREGIRRIGVLSEFARAELGSFGVPPERVDVLPPGFPTPPLPVRPPEPHPFTFLLVGRDPERKGADRAMAAVRALRERGLAVRLVLAGDPSYEEIGGEDGIEGLPRVERERLYGELYPAADAFLLPARAEGYGLVAVEAMSFGLPVVATRRDALPEIVGDAGVLVGPRGEGLDEALEALVREPSRARELGRRARERFQRIHTLEAHGERMRAFYERALEG